MIPDWVGEQPVIEGITFGYGSYGHRCRLCAQDNWEGPLVHLPGCPGASLEAPPAAKPPDENPDDPDLWDNQ